jgi:glutamate/tyrosine decarboxylase-like PLP-dependent enzyme
MSIDREDTEAGKPLHQLQLSPAQMRSLGYRVVDMIVEHFEHGAGERVSGRMSRTELESRLRQPLPEEPASEEQIFRQLEDDVLAAMSHVDHPRFFAYVPGPNNFVGAMADALVAGFNVFAGAWPVASGPAQIELVTIDWLRQLCGLPEGAGGLFTSGGSIANLTALTVARQLKLGDDFARGVIYYSDQTHSSIDRGLRTIGIREEQIRRLASDDDLCLSVHELERHILADRAAGLLPFCVIANAGTTNTGAVDPLVELGELCRRESLWLHVDGAYGAAAVLSDKGRTLLRGIEYADSITLDPHKWLFQPFEIGCLLVRDRRVLRQTFHILPEYLRDSERDEEEVNFRDYGIQLTRGFRALKLWMSLKLFGARAFRDAVAWGIELAEIAERELRSTGCWEIVTHACLGIVSFRYSLPKLSLRDADAITQALPEKMYADGFAMLSSTELKGRIALRLCTINPRTSAEDVKETVRRLTQLAHSQGELEGRAGH